MPPKGYSFWDNLMEEQGVFIDDRPDNFKGGPDFLVDVKIPFPNYNVGDVIVGEIVEEEQ